MIFQRVSHHVDCNNPCNFKIRTVGPRQMIWFTCVQYIRRKKITSDFDISWCCLRVGKNAIRFKVLGWMNTYTDILETKTTYLVVQIRVVFFVVWLCYTFRGTRKMQDNPIPTQHLTMTLAELNKADWTVNCSQQTLGMVCFFFFQKNCDHTCGITGITCNFCMNFTWFRWVGGKVWENSMESGSIRNCELGRRPNQRIWPRQPKKAVIPWPGMPAGCWSSGNQWILWLVHIPHVDSVFLVSGNNIFELATFFFVFRCRKSWLFDCFWVRK